MAARSLSRLYVRSVLPSSTKTNWYSQSMSSITECSRAYNSVMLSSSLWKGTTMETVGFAVRSDMVHLSPEGAIHCLKLCQLRRHRASDRSHIHFAWNVGRCAGTNFHRECRKQVRSIRFDFVGLRGKAVDSE